MLIHEFFMYISYSTPLETMYSKKISLCFIIFFALNKIMFIFVLRTLCFSGKSWNCIGIIKYKLKRSSKKGCLRQSSYKDV